MRKSPSRLLNAPPIMRLVLCAGVALSVATQLRPGALPVGPGELLIVLWLVGLLGVLGLKNGRIEAGQAFREMLMFWLAVFLALAIGTFAGSQTGHVELTSSLRNWASLLLAAVFCLGLSCTDSDDSEWRRRLELFVVISVLFAGVLLTTGLVQQAAGRSTLLFVDNRFRGLGENPNQLALAMSVVLFFCLHLAFSQSNRKSARHFAILAVAVVAIGIATRSDALKVAWVSGIAATVMALWLRGPGLRGGHKTVVVWRLGMPLLLIGVVAVGALSTIDLIKNMAVEVYSFGGQGEGRLALWINGLRAVGESPVAGFGPGAYSGRYAPFGQMEAHSTPIDWLTYAGFLGFVLAFLFLMLIFLRLYRTRNVLLLGALVALLVFSLFHNVIRHPVVWFTVAYLLNEGLHKRECEPNSNGRAPNSAAANGLGG